METKPHLTTERLPHRRKSEIALIQSHGLKAYEYLSFTEHARQVVNAPIAQMPVFVSYHTPDKRYVAAMKRLRQSLEFLKLDYFIACANFPDGTPWVTRAAGKADMLQGARKTHPGRPLVWIDADDIVNRTPWFLGSLQGDVAFRMADRYRIAGNLVYFADTPAANQVLDLWAWACDLYANAWDEIALAWAWHTVNTKTPMRTDFLPLTGLVTSGNNSRGIIAQGNASSGLHDYDYEKNTRHYTNAFKRAMLELDFSRPFMFTEILR